jgi:hypothetical protein
VLLQSDVLGPGEVNLLLEFAGTVVHRQTVLGFERRLDPSKCVLLAGC